MTTDLPQEPPAARVDRVSAVTAGNIPIVTVNKKHTDNAKTQIYSEKSQKQQNRTHIFCH